MAIEWRSNDGVYLPMINDGGRNRFYKAALEAKAPGKTVVDIGSGTGFLTILACHAGAKHVIAVEQDPERAQLTQENVNLCGFQDRVTVVNANWMDVNITGDIYVSETICTNLWNEKILEISEHAIRNGGEFIPGRFDYKFQVYKNHPLFAVVQSSSEAYDFEPEIAIDEKFEEAIRQKVRDDNVKYRQNAIFNLFQAANRSPADMKPVMDALELVHETEWFTVDLNQPNHCDYKQFEHQINLKDLPKAPGYCILLTWRAVTGDIVMEHWDTIFGTPSKIIPSPDYTVVNTSYELLGNQWYFRYE